MFTKKPWGKRVPIYEDLKLNIQNESYELPDEEIRKSCNGFGWVPGALDGAFGHHAGSSEVDIKMVQLLKNIALNGKMKDKVEFYRYVEKDQVGLHIDLFIEKIIDIKTPNSDYLKEWIRFLTLESPDRGAVKMGIALAGVVGYIDLIDQIRTLGKHEEFTLYTSVALMNLSTDPEKELWELAKSVHGWGRIHLVERLEGTQNREIKEWILRDGYKNSIMYEYLAIIAAETGELHVALDRNEVDNDLLLSASEIIEALIMEGPVAGISVYEHGFFVITKFIEHTIKKPKNISYLITYDQINDYIDSIELNEFELKQGWSAESVKEVRLKLNMIFNDVSWKDYVLSLVNTNDEVEFWKVNQAAKIFKLDMKAVHWKKVREEPENSGRWYRLIESYGEKIDNELLDYARVTLPLDEMCLGAKNELGLGQEYRNYSILMFILQSLRDKEGLGEDFVLYGLNSPVINNRNMAINVIESWDRNLINNKILKKINLAIKSETNSEVKKRLEKLIYDNTL